MRACVRVCVIYGKESVCGRGILVVLMDDRTDVQVVKRRGIGEGRKLLWESRAGGQDALWLGINTLSPYITHTHPTTHDVAPIFCLSSQSSPATRSGGPSLFAAACLWQVRARKTGQLVMFFTRSNRLHLSSRAPTPGALRWTSPGLPSELLSLSDLGVIVATNRDRLLKNQCPT
jgi:hypothetical protein